MYLLLRDGGAASRASSLSSSSAAARTGSESCGAFVREKPQSLRRCGTLQL